MKNIDSIFKILDDSIQRDSTMFCPFRDAYSMLFGYRYSLNHESAEWMATDLLIEYYISREIFYSPTLLKSMSVDKRLALAKSWQNLGKS